MRRIAHLSDLHYGADPETQPKLYEGLLEALRGEVVDFLFFTGDVFDTNDPAPGLVDGFLRLHAGIEAALGGPKPTVILPGNHDRRAEGVFAPYREDLFTELREKFAHRPDVQVLGQLTPFLAQRLALPGFPFDVVAYDSAYLPYRHRLGRRRGAPARPAAGGRRAGPKRLHPPAALPAAPPPHPHAGHRHLHHRHARPAAAAEVPGGHGAALAGEQRRPRRAHHDRAGRRLRAHHLADARPRGVGAARPQALRHRAAAQGHRRRRRPAHHQRGQLRGEPELDRRRLRAGADAVAVDQLPRAGRRLGAGHLAGLVALAAGAPQPPPPPGARHPRRRAAGRCSPRRPTTRPSSRCSP